jgi:hypothetical protein
MSGYTTRRREGPVGGLEARSPAATAIGHMGMMAMAGDPA